MNIWHYHKISSLIIADLLAEGNCFRCSSTMWSKYCFWSSCLVRIGLNACMSPTPLLAKSLTTFNHCTFSWASMKDESCSHKLGSFNRNCNDILFNTKSFLLFLWQNETAQFEKQYFFYVNTSRRIITIFFSIYIFFSGA